MNHSHLEELLSAYADGELPRTQREFVDGHVTGCAVCRATLADHTWERSQLMSLRSTPVPSDLKQAAMSKIEAAQTLKRLLPVSLSPALSRPALLVAGAIVVVIAALVLDLSGTGRDGPIAEAEAATAALRSYRAVESVTITKYGDTFEKATQVEVSAPDRFRVKATEKDGRVVEFIGIGDEQYVRGAGKEYAYVHDVAAKVGGFLDMVIGPNRVYDLGGLASNKSVALEIVGSLLDLEQLPDEMIDGISTLRYRGKMDWGKIGWETKKKRGDPDSPSYAELWIDKDEYTIRQAKVVIHILVEDPEYQEATRIGFTAVVKYFDFNEPIEIRPPVTASGALEPEWSLVENGRPYQKNKAGPANLEKK